MNILSKLGNFAECPTLEISNSIGGPWEGEPGDTVTVSCHHQTHSLVFKFSVTLTCEDSGQWSSLPACDEIGMNNFHQLRFERVGWVWGTWGNGIREGAGPQTPNPDITK